MVKLNRWDSVAIAIGSYIVISGILPYSVYASDGITETLITAFIIYFASLSLWTSTIYILTDFNIERVQD
jgi:hypothetical protein